MPQDKTAHRPPVSNRNPFSLFLGCLLGILGFLFFDSFKSEQVLFANDGPLGAALARWVALPDIFTGAWLDLNWLGNNAGSASPIPTNAVRWLLGGVLYAKFYSPIALFILGLCAWWFFRQLRFRPIVCLLGAVAATLNTNIFSNVCWGLGTRALTFAAIFLALGALVSPGTKYAWLKVILTGMAVGMGVMEGADNGAIFSLYVAAFVLFQAWLEENRTARRIVTGLGRLALIAVFAGIMATHALISLIETQFVGVAKPPQEQQGNQENWDRATQWSLPKIETLRVVIPGLFGCRMDTPNGGNYWGAVGQTPGWENHQQGYPRYSGAGEYAGVLVALIAAWAVAMSLQRPNTPNPVLRPAERKWVWFWSIAALISLLFAFGRYAPFYRAIYALPYFSSIRNPIKFMHPFHLALLVLFGYGLQGLTRRYLEQAVSKSSSLPARLKSWWAAAPAFEKKWTLGSVGVVTASLLGWLLYAASRSELVRHLQRVGFDDSKLAGSIARFSFAETGWFVLFLAASVGLLTLILSGGFAGPRAKWAGILLGALLVVDLGRADKPWIVYYNYKEKYASNPVIDILRDRPFEHRVSLPSFQAPPQLEQQFLFFRQLYQVEWMQHHFPYYNVQSLDIVQMPRAREDYAKFNQAVAGTPARLWQLTNTRFLLSLAGFVETLNQQLDPVQRRFRIHTAFEISAASPSGPFDVRTNTTGPFALIEFTGALSRAKLYTHWQLATNDAVTLQQLAAPAFDPARTVFVAGDLPATSATNSTATEAGPVDFISYAPKRLVLAAKTQAQAVLLLNDRFDPDWKVWVDGKPEKLLRCNYVMRGVYLPPGQHTVEFRFQPLVTGLYVSLSAIVLGLALCAVLCFSKQPAEEPTTRAAPPAPPAPPAADPKKPHHKS